MKMPKQVEKELTLLLVRWYNETVLYLRGEFLYSTALTGCSGSMPMRSALVAAGKTDDLSGSIPTGSADSNPVGGLSYL